MVVVCDILFFNLTNATKVASVYLILGIILLSLSFYIIVRLIISQFLKFYIKKGHKVALYLTFLFLTMVAFQSSGELSWSDLVVLIALILVSYVYTSYLKTDKQHI